MAEMGQAGHRQRLRERLLAGEAESHSDERLLELLLTFAILRKDVRPLAQKLLREFGSLSQVLSTPPDKLAKVKGIGQSSIALLQVINYIRSTSDLIEKNNPALPQKASQQKLFEEITDNLSAERKDDLKNINTEMSKVAPIPASQQGKEQEPVLNYGTVSNPQKPELDTKIVRRKFQVSNGYLLEFDQLARVLHFLLEHREAKKITSKLLQEDTGLADRQIENLVSMGSAMGLIKSGNQILTPIGLLVASHDIFIEKKGTLEWCHYAAAGSYRNTIWFEVFNHLLTEPSPMTQDQWQDRLRSELAGGFTEKTLGKGLREEVRFVINAYTERNFSKLELLFKSPDDRLYRRRYTNFTPLVFSAMIYDFCAANKVQLYQVEEMAVALGSPSVVFGLDPASFRQQIESLHERGWLRYETTHNLDQVRLKPGFSALEFLKAHFEEREPHEESNQSIRGMIE
jgi:DNA repair protein RadC